jgi:hypothetical protein
VSASLTWKRSLAAGESESSISHSSIPTGISHRNFPSGISTYAIGFANRSGDRRRSQLAVGSAQQSERFLGMEEVTGRRFAAGESESSISHSSIPTGISHRNFPSGIRYSSGMSPPSPQVERGWG